MLAGELLRSKPLRGHAALLVRIRGNRVKSDRRLAGSRALAGFLTIAVGAVIGDRRTHLAVVGAVRGSRATVTHNALHRLGQRRGK